jgi:hypothetical protein
MRLALALTIGLFAGLLWSIPAARANPAKNPQVMLEEGRVAYERGNYGEAVQTIHPLLYPSIELRNEEAVIEAHRLLALSYLFMTKPSEAEQEAASLLALRPDYEPDPVVDPPAAVAFFHSIKKKQDDRLREVRERQRTEEERLRREEEKKREQAHAKAERVYVERLVEHHSRAVAFVPFGVGQFYNHHKVSGALVLTAEALLAIAWGATTLAIYLRYPNGQFPFADRDTANTLLGVQVGTGTAFWAVVVAGIIDAQVRFVPEFTVGTKELPGGLSLDPRKQPPKLPKTTLAPIVAPGLYGLGVQGVW